MCGAVLMTALPAIGLAEVLPDPTRPTHVIEGAVAAESMGNRLSSIVRPQQGRAYAVIDGRIVHVGEKVGDAKLVRIQESSVELRSAEGSETLSLTPGIDKSTVMPTSRKTAGQKSP